MADRRTHITEHFTWAEFACHDGTPVPREKRSACTRLCANLEVLRAELGDRPMTVVSGYRTPLYNAGWRDGVLHPELAGAKDSQHPHARAGDVVVKGFTPDQVADTAERLMAEGRMEQGGLGRYDKFTHIDVRGYPARWDKRTATKRAKANAKPERASR